jgi:hypothetical protein
MKPRMLLAILALSISPSDTRLTLMKPFLLRWLRTVSTCWRLVCHARQHTECEARSRVCRGERAGKGSGERETGPRRQVPRTDRIERLPWGELRSDGSLLRRNACSAGLPCLPRAAAAGCRQLPPASRPRFASCSGARSGGGRMGRSGGRGQRAARSAMSSGTDLKLCWLARRLLGREAEAQRTRTLPRLDLHGDDTALVR